MGKISPEAPPTSVAIGATPAAIAHNVRVVDSKTGVTIAKVLSADSVAGKVRRYAVDGNGNLVREKNRFKVIAEDRACSIEWIVPPASAAAAEKPVIAEAEPAAPVADVVLEEAKA